MTVPTLLHDKTKEVRYREFILAVNSTCALDKAYGSALDKNAPERINSSQYMGDRETTAVAELQIDKERREIPVITSAEKPSRAYAEFKVQNNANEMVSLLKKIGDNLDNAQGAAYMVGFRQHLDDMWKFESSLPKERVILFSAVEEVVRGKKWRELNKKQITVLIHIVEQVSDKTLTDKKMSQALALIQNSSMDIYPSSKVDDQIED